MNPKALYTAAKWAAFVLGGVFLLGLLTLAILMAFLQTEFGRNKVADAVESLTEGTSFAVRLQGIGPGLPRHLRLKEVEVADPEGVWLRVRGVDVQWAIADGLKGLYHFPRIQADDLEWLRMPRLEETTGKW
jgi:autotransporter translocation and assembly factor TamB